jgi:outer membrane protein assembly factor BamB
MFWLMLAIACSDYKLTGNKGNNTGSDGDTDTTSNPVSDAPKECQPSEYPAEKVAIDDTCHEAPEGGFEPIEEWTYGAGQGCLSLPIVADLDGDGLPEVIVNLTTGIGLGTGKLVVLDGHGNKKFIVKDAKLGYGSPPAVGDIDGDGKPDIVTVREYQNSMMAKGDYTAVAYENDGTVKWESDHFTGMDFDYATSPSLADLDEDGEAEVILGRVILHGADGTTRGVGKHGRGSYGITNFGGQTISESSVSAVADLDLDGMQEVIVGNAAYDADGNDVYSNDQDDAMIGIANVDDDPDGEIVAVTHDTVRVLDTDGTKIWGPKQIPSANIVSPPAIGDLDLDGKPEIVVAGGNKLRVYNAEDGTVLWTANVTDESGATGASIFDFEGDGIPEVVYIDEVEMIAFDGPTGAVKFYSTDHASPTMFDYPTIADVDADGHAEILVCHDGYDVALTAYGDKSDSWAGARQVWNQHAYSITNINDDLSIPQKPVQGFTASNTWHSAIATTGLALGLNLSAEILAVCRDDCDDGTLYVTGRVRNSSKEDVPAGLSVTLYALQGAKRDPLATVTLSKGIPAAMTSDAMDFAVSAAAVAKATGLLLVADDDGHGNGTFPECSEADNAWSTDGPFCE